MQSLRELSGKLAANAIPGLFAFPFRKPSKRKSKAKRGAAKFSGGSSRLPRKVLRIERPGWRDKFRRGEAPTHFAAGVLAGFYMLIGCSGIVLGGYGSAIGEGLRSSAGVAARYLGFAITDVRVVGGSRLSNKEIVQLLHINDGASSFTLNVNAARERLLDIPWVKSANVRLLMPGTLQVSLIEREPYALWQHAGHIMMIDKDGREIGFYNDTRFSVLPLIVGEGASQQAKGLLDLLQQYPSLQARTRAAIYVAGRRWNLKLTDGVDVKLPENNMDTALQKLADLDKDSALLNRDIAAVDLRLPDRVVIRLTDNAVQQHMSMLKARAKGPRKFTPAAAPQISGGRA